MIHASELPQMRGDRLFLTDGGIETTLIYEEGLDLPHFAAFDLLRSERGRRTLRSYFTRYVRLAEAMGTGLVLESATWRANPDWAALLGYDDGALARANRRAIDLLAWVRDEMSEAAGPVVLSGCIGPRGDGYVVGDEKTAAESARYHGAQVSAFAESGADVVSAITMTYCGEAIGIANAACARDMHAVLSFTVETDGRLPSGQPLGEAIEEVDEATGAYPAYYMINCAHPSHFRHVLEEGAAWIPRIGGLRTNASCMSHEELDRATELDDGDPSELAQEHEELMALLPGLRVVGGCCGTDERHVEAIARACFRSWAVPA